MTRKLSFSRATLEAMTEEMDRDPSVFLMGEDIAKQGGIFGQYKGLTDQFGLERVRDFPISEAVLISASIGAALTGGRPVADIHFSDFLGCAMDELTNQAAKLRYMFGGQASVPIVVRAPEGAINSAAAQHSQSLESWFVHTPGWRVVSPSNAADAKGLLKAAIRCNDPVLYLEHKALYSKKSLVPDDEDFIVPIGKARTVREGSDLTIVSWSLSLTKCITAAESIAGHGVEAEVLDLRTLSPWDVQAVLASVRRTGRLLIVHEAVRSCGLGAEIAATIAEHAFDSLRAPIRRLANPDLPIPFSPSLESCVLPQVASIEDAIRLVVA